MTCHDWCVCVCFFFNIFVAACSVQWHATWSTCLLHFPHSVRHENEPEPDSWPNHHKLVVSKRLFAYVCFTFCDPQWWQTQRHTVYCVHPWTASLFRVFQVSPLCFQSTTFQWWSATTCFKDQTAIWFKCIQVRLWKDQLLILSLISFIGFNFLPSFKSRLVKPGGISGHFTSQDPQVLNTVTLWSHLRKAPCHHPAMKVLIFWRPWYINTHILNNIYIYTLRFQMLCLTSQLLKD